MEILFATIFGGPPSFLLTVEVGPCKPFPRLGEHATAKTIPCGLVLKRARSLKTE